MHLHNYVTKFAKRGLIHAPWQDTDFTAIVLKMPQKLAKSVADITIQ